MKTVILMRHADAAWAAGGEGDLDRPLTAHGEAAASLTGAWLSRSVNPPEVILCSPARRTRQTVEAIRRAAPGLPEPNVLPGLYLAPPETILDAIAGVGADISSVLVVGHEPGLSAMLRRFADGGVPTHFPPAALAVIELAADDWNAARRAQARVAAFVRPRDLVK